MFVIGYAESQSLRDSSLLIFLRGDVSMLDVFAQ